MHQNVYDLLEPAARARLLGRPTSEILAAPLEALEVIPNDVRKRLRDQHGVTRVEELRKIDLRDFRFPPDIIAILMCVLNYPQHDPGPGCAWEQLFQAAPLTYYTGYPGSPFHTHFGPAYYRGRLNGTAKVLVVGQDPATDETLAGRAFVGQAGQLAQNFLTKIGITRSYVMFNTFLYGVQSTAITAALANDATIAAYRNQLFDRAKSTNPITLVLAFGSWANTAVTAWPGLGTLPVVHVTHPTAPSGVQDNWNMNLPTAASHVTPDWDGHVDLTPYSTTSPLPWTDIPRRDLPFGIPPWHGTGGATRSLRVSGAFETEIMWTAP